MLLTKNQLKSLIDQHEGLSVSIYMPTHRAGPEIQQSSIQLKNILREAEERLTKQGMRAPEARQLLQPAQELIEDDQFWQHQSDGLAMFLGTDFFRYFRLPLDFDELLVVSERFHIKPLLPLLSGDGQFHIMALSQNEVRLYQGSKYNIREIDLATVPQSLADALRFDVVQRQHQFHTKTGRGGGGERAAIHHGQGSGKDDENNQLLRYFQGINKGIQELLQTEQTPLVLAGVDYLVPIYEEANSYNGLMSDSVSGNPENLKPTELHQKAWEIVEPVFTEAQDEAKARYKNLSNTDQSSKDIRKIVPAAQYKRVDTLFVALDAHQWGTFDAEDNTIEMHKEVERGDADLLDEAAIATMMNGGTVYAMPQNEVPDQVPLAAIFRY